MPRLHPRACFLGLVFVLFLGPGCATLTPSPTSTPAPAVTATLPASATAPPPSSTPLAVADTDLRIEAGGLKIHPEPGLYSGDRVSFEVVAQSSDDVELRDVAVAITLDSSDSPLVQGTFSPFGIGARPQATFTWAWDTTGLTGPHTLTVTLDPENVIVVGDENSDNNTLVVPIVLRPAAERPAPENEARWTETRSECCVFHYMTSTAAERDLAAIMAAADRGLERAQTVLGVTLTQPITFNMVGRLLGHGGFAANEITISYLDRDYAGGGLDSVFTHEIAHVLDEESHDGFRPTLLVEGLAVYVAGGHFKSEDLDRRAAALVASGRYIPLAQLADNFYPSQHEIGYLEGGALIAYLVQTYGWEAFNAFYHDIPEPESGQSQSEVLDLALAAHFRRGLADVEADWLAHLRTLPVEPDQLADLLDTVMFYDTVRRYQLALDPSAHFLQAWIPDVPTARKEGLVGDYLRHPTAPENIALETMFVAADRGLKAGNYTMTETLLAEVNAVLDGVEAGDADPFDRSPLAAEYRAVVLATASAGYEAQHIAFDDVTARVTAIRDWPLLNELTLDRLGEAWVVSE